MNLRSITWIFVLVGLPALWNGCGNVAFESGSGNYKSCAVMGADLSNCFNPQPGILKDMSQSINVAAQTDVDILFVVDNSGSMQEEQNGIGQKINGFLDKIKSLNWQIAITTTDDRAETPVGGGVSRPWSDGNFRPFDSDTGNQFILRSTQESAANAQTKLSNAIQMGISGSGNERGINATYRAVSRSVAPSPHRDFFRPIAKLAVVLISDEDECSKGISDCPAATASRSVPQNLVDHVRATLGATKGFSFNSIIFIPGDSSCTTGANAGNTYKELSQLTNGVLGSVCASDFSSPLAAIGNQVVQLVNSATLSCAPVDVNGDNKPDLQIILAGGAQMTSGFEIKGVNVTFANPLPAGNHRFYFFCK